MRHRTTRRKQASSPARTAATGKSQRTSSSTLVGWFVILLAFRCANALTVRTQFDPDEFWQALEPARRLVYGQGWLTWEWVPAVGLRSWLHPLMLAVPWWVLKVTGLDFYLSISMFALMPRLIVHAPLLALADLSVGWLTERAGGTFQHGLMASTTNWFMWYSGVRTYTNSIEGVLLIVAVAWFWPLSADEFDKFDVTKALILAAFSVSIRPSSLVSWLYLGGMLALVDLGVRSSRLWSLILFRVIPIGGAILVGTVIIDSHFYEEMVIVPWRFFDFNVVRGLSSLYGTHPFYWYFVECFPAILGIQLVPILASFFSSNSSSQTRAVQLRLGGLVLFCLFIMSLSPHKELRFAFPPLTIALVFVAIGIEASLPMLSSNLVYTVVIIGGILPATFLSLIHQRAAIDAIEFISSTASGSIDILLPCHAMPLWAFTHPVHSKVSRFDFLDCSPGIPELRYSHNLNSSFEALSSLHATNRFKLDPLSFTNQRYMGAHKFPNVIVTGTKFLPQVTEALASFRSYIICGEFDHTREEDVGQSIIVLCINSTSITILGV